MHLWMKYWRNRIKTTIVGRTGLLWWTWPKTTPNKYRELKSTSSKTPTTILFGPTDSTASVNSKQKI